jgi:hypothetical protein
MNRPMSGVGARGLVIAGVLALVGTVGVCGSGPASAARPDASSVTRIESCTSGSGSADYSPGVSFTPVAQTITVPSAAGPATTFSGCTGKDHSVTSGTLTASFTTAQGISCSFPVESNGTLYASGTATIVWNNGRTSSGPAKIDADGQPQQGTVVIDLTRGEFAGTSSHPHPARATFFFQPVNGTCPFTTVDASLLSKFKIKS